MAELTTDATLNGHSISITVREDTNGDGVADNTETVSIGGGVNTYPLSALVTEPSYLYSLDVDIGGSSSSTAILHSAELNFDEEAPSGLSVVEGTAADDFDLDWTDNDEYTEGEWRIFRSTVDNPTYPGDYTHIDTVTDATITSYTDTVQKDGRTFSYFVRRAVNGYTKDTGTVSLVFNDEDQPVLGNGVEDEIAVDRETVVSDYGDVRIQIRETGQSAWDSTATGFAEQVLNYATLTTTFGTLEDGEEYEVRARSEAEYIDGTWTTPVSIVTKFPGPSGLTVGTVTKTSVDLSWTDNSDNEDGFDVERAKVYDSGPGLWRTLDTLAANTTTHTDSTPQPGREYQYRIRAFTEHTDAASGTVTATTTGEGANTSPVPSSGPWVEVDHPNRDAPLTPSILDDGIDFPHQVNDLPRVRIPVPKKPNWLGDEQLEGQSMRVWLDGKRLPIGQLENVTEQSDRVILEGRGGLDLTQRVEKEFVEREAHLGARDILDQAGVSNTVDDPQSNVTTNDRMQSADTTTEWSDNFPSSPDSTDVIAVKNGNLTTDQTAWFGEVESSYKNGTEQIESSSSRWSGGRVVEWTVADSLSGFDRTVTTGHKIPAANAKFAVRLQIPRTGNHGFQLYIDGEVVEDVSADLLADNETSPDWFEAGGTPSTDLSAGSHTVEFRLDGNDPSANDGRIQADCWAFYDDRHGPGLTEQVTDNVITGPDLHPSGISQEMADATTFMTVIAGELTSTWNDTTGDQAVAISNDLGQNWIEATNSETVSGQFASGGAQIRARFRLSGYDTNPTVSPAGRKKPHEVDLYDLYADLDDTPLLIQSKYDGQAIEALQQIADFSDSIFSVEWDSDIGDYHVTWTQPGLRTTEASVGLVDYETTKTNEDSYEQVVVKGQAKRKEREVISPNPTHDLDHKHIVEGSGTVYDPGANTTYTESVDYELNRIPGTIEILSGGSMVSGDTYEITYNWKVSGSYAPPDAPTNPKTLVRDVPSIPTGRQAEQAALYLHRAVDEPLIESTATLDDIPPSVSIVETITLPDLPTGGESVELREIDQSGESPTITLGNRQGLREAMQRIRSQLQAVSRLV